MIFAHFAQTYPCQTPGFRYSQRSSERFLRRKRSAFQPSGGDPKGSSGTCWAWTGLGLERLWLATSRKGSEFELSEIKLKKGEPVDRALRRLKKKVDREGTLKEVRNHRHYEKPSERRRRKMKVARFSAMLSARYADA